MLAARMSPKKSCGVIPFFGGQTSNLLLAMHDLDGQLEMPISVFMCP
jgi:hypothetical protein